MVPNQQLPITCSGLISVLLWQAAPQAPSLDELHAEDAHEEEEVELKDAKKVQTMLHSIVHIAAVSVFQSSVVPAGHQHLLVLHLGMEGDPACLAQ